MPERIFTDIQVNIFRQFHDKIGFANLSKEFGLKPSAYYSLLRKETYRNVPYIGLNYDDFRHLEKSASVAKVIRKGQYIDSIHSVRDNSSGIYLIINIENNKCYVGSSYNIRNRLFWHYNELDKGSHPNNILQNAVNKYGLDKFNFIPILNCPFEYNSKLEQWVKDKTNLDTCYNIAKDCLTPALGMKMSDAEKKKISDRNKGHKWSSEQKERLKKVLKKRKMEIGERAYAEKRLKNLEQIRKGELNGRSKLTDSERCDVIAMINNSFNDKDIAIEYPQITSKLIGEVRAGRTWKQFNHLILQNV
jgi:group I intron endonuclease